MSERLALVSDCGGGQLRKEAPWTGQWNCVEGISRALGADLWHGNHGDMALDYDTYIVNGNETLWWLPGWLKQRGKRVVFMWEGPFELILNDKLNLRLLQALDACDGVMAFGPAFVERTKAFHPRVCWTSCVIEAKFPKRGGDASGPWLNAPSRIRRGLPGALALRAAGIRFVQYVHAEERQAWEAWLRGAAVEYRDVVDHDRYLQALPGFCAALNWDTQSTCGRHVIDCSAAGVPCLTADTAGTSAFIPPYLVVAPPPSGYQDLMSRICSDSWLRAVRREGMPYIEAITPARIREEWERFRKTLD